MCLSIRLSISAHTSFTGKEFEIVLYVVIYNYLTRHILDAVIQLILQPVTHATTHFSPTLCANIHDKQKLQFKTSDNNIYHTNNRKRNCTYIILDF